MSDPNDFLKLRSREEENEPETDAAVTALNMRRGSHRIGRPLLMTKHKLRILCDQPGRDLEVRCTLFFYWTGVYFSKTPPFDVTESRAHSFLPRRPWISSVPKQNLITLVHVSVLHFDQIFIQIPVGGGLAIAAGSSHQGFDSQVGLQSCNFRIFTVQCLLQIRLLLPHPLQCFRLFLGLLAGGTHKTFQFMRLPQTDVPEIRNRDGPVL